MSEVTITIYNHNYRLAVSTGEEDLLRECAAVVDRQMQRMRTAGKVIASDQIAVLTALELAYEAAKRRNDADEALEAARAEVQTARRETEEALAAAEASRRELEGERAETEALRASAALLEEAPREAEEARRAADAARNATEAANARAEAAESELTQLRDEVAALRERLASLQAQTAKAPAPAVDSEDARELKNLCRMCEEAIFMDRRPGALF